MREDLQEHFFFRIDSDIAEYLLDISISAVWLQKKNTLWVTRGEIIDYVSWNKRTIDQIQYEISEYSAVWGLLEPIHE